LTRSNGFEELNDIVVNDKTSFKLKPVNTGCRDQKLRVELTRSLLFSILPPFRAQNRSFFGNNIMAGDLITSIHFTVLSRHKTSHLYKNVGPKSFVLPIRGRFATSEVNQLCLVTGTPCAKSPAITIVSEMSFISVPRGGAQMEHSMDQVKSPPIS